MFDLNRSLTAWRRALRAVDTRRVGSRLDARRLLEAGPHVTVLNDVTSRPAGAVARLEPRRSFSSSISSILGGDTGLAVRGGALEEAPPD
jgi:hypothetical protein